MTFDRFTQEALRVRQKLDLLRRGGAMEQEQHDYLESALEELQTAVEELQVADEELRAQNDELLITRAGIEQERLRYQELFDFAPDGYLVTDVHGIIREANRAASARLHLPDDFIVGKPLANFVAPADRSAFRYRLALMHQADRPQTEEWEVRLQPRGLPAFYAALTVAPVWNPQGQVTALRWMVRDITDRKRAEAELHELNTALEARVRERTAQLEAANAVQERLLQSERAARAAAEAAQQRLAFLAQTGALLAGSLDYEMTLNGVAAAAVPAFADWCVVNLIEDDGSVHDVAVAHANPDKLDLVREIQRRYPPDPDTYGGYAAVLNTGRSFLMAEATEEWLREISRDEDQLRLMQAIGPRSYMITPLVARGRLFGTMAFAITESERRYTPNDLALAEGLAYRAALAVDNARLYRAAENQRRRLQAVLDHIPEGVIIADAPDGRITLYNDAALRLRRRPVTGATLHDEWRAVQPCGADGQPFAYDDMPLARALRGELVLGEEMVLPHVGGERLVLLTSAAPIYDEGGAITAAVTVFQDITQRKTLEELKDGFLSLAAHELRTPLTAIRSSAQLLLRGVGRQVRTIGPLEERVLRVIEDRTTYVVGLVNELLDLSRIQAGRLELRPEPVDLAALLWDVVRQQHEAHPETPFTLTGADQPIPGAWDPGRLEQVFSNLLDNAVKYSPPGRPVDLRVTVSPDQGHVQVDVQDRGIGVPAADLPHIFERHYRAGNVGRSPSGLGLGLYLSQEMVRRHGGRIWVESVEGEGATFHVRLPLHGTALAADS